MADVVATSPGFASTDGLREVWDVTAEVAVGTALVNGTRAGVAYTPSGAHQISKTVGPYTVSGGSDGGESLPALKVSVATDGSWEFPITGATAATPNGTAVFAAVTAGRATNLTLTTGGTAFGVINNPLGYDKPGAFGLVKIGV